MDSTLQDAIAHPGAYLWDRDIPMTVPELYGVIGRIEQRYQEVKCAMILNISHYRQLMQDASPGQNISFGPFPSEITVLGRRAHVLPPVLPCTIIYPDHPNYTQVESLADILEYYVPTSSGRNISLEL